MFAPQSSRNLVTVFRRVSLMRERLIEGAGGVRLHVVEEGDPASPHKVVLLHGFPDFWYGWRHQIPVLADSGFHVIAPDLRGYNSSDKPGEIAAYRLVHLVDDVSALIAKLGVTSVHLVGHDWGGVVAWVFAMHHPAAVRRLAILNIPHPEAIRRGRKRLKQLARLWYQGFLNLPRVPELVLKGGRYAALRMLLNRSLKRTHALSDGDRERYLEAWSQPGALSASLNYYRALIRLGTGLPSPPRVALDVPTLLIWGEQEPVFLRSLAEGSRESVTTLKIAYVADAGHFVQQDAPAVVNDLLLSWFAS